MTHTFHINAEVATMVSESRPEGSFLEIDCHTPQGEETRLRLEFTTDGMERFAEMIMKFVRTAHDVLGQAPATPAAEPTSGGTHAASHHSIERYSITRLPEGEVRRLVDALQPYQGGGAQGAEFGGPHRVVVWQVSDPRSAREGEEGRRLYLSPGALDAARRAGIEIQVLGEVSRREIPEGRELLTGNPPVEWQDTAG